MPGNYAHYRMGVVLLPTFPADVRRTIGRFRRLFDVGLHGPDIFFYHGLPVPTATGALGSKHHAQTGREFFQRGCRVVRLEASEAAQAYLYGVLCHYALDSACHTFINEQAQIRDLLPLEIETEFDRFLLYTDGKRPPESQDLTNHLKLTPGECATVAKFYPPATARQVQDSLHRMGRIVKLLSTPEGNRRTVLRKGLSALGPHAGAMLMTTGENTRCASLNHQLLDRYHSIMENFPELLSQLQAHLTYNGLFGEEFTKIFG